MENNNLVKQFDAGKLAVRIYTDRNAMGRAVAHDVAQKMTKILSLQNNLRMIFAAAPSQNEFLSSLCNYDIEWEKVEAFHMDEYLGIDPDAPQGFAHFLTKAIFGKKQFKTVNTIDSKALIPEMECIRYSNLLLERSVDICAMGIGENGHLAFNDPPVANFNDSLLVKTVELDPVCRQQQVNDGCFSEIEKVPTHAFTLTIPALINCSHLFVTVPGKTKANAVYKTITQRLGEACPSTVLRNCSNAVLYLDLDSASKIL